MTTPRGFSDQIWVVVFHHNGERHTFLTEPLGGIVAWSKGADATVVEYKFVAVTHTPPLKKASSK